VPNGQQVYCVTLLSLYPVTKQTSPSAYYFSKIWFMGSSTSKTEACNSQIFTRLRKICKKEILLFWCNPLCIFGIIKKRKFISLKYIQQDATFSRSTYVYKLLYMFQAFPPPIIRSTKLYIQNQVLSNQYCCLLLSWMSSQAVSKPVWHIPLLCVKWKTPDDGQRNCPKHV